MIKCVIIDDEQPAIDVLKHYISKFPELELAATFTSPIEALKFIGQSSIDLVFLDIQMDGLTGIEVAKIINHQAKIIFCTAYPNFAIDGFDLNALDYLLKPVSLERFEKAIKKVSAQNSETKNADYLLVKTEQKGKFVKIQYSEILYVESLGNYVSFNLKDKKVTTYSKMRDLEEHLPTEFFVRIHKSYIINLTKMVGIENGFALLQNQSVIQKISIGNTYKELLFQKLNTKFF